MSRIALPPEAEVERVLRAALAEDLGEGGDVTSNALVPAEAHAEATLLAEQELVAAGAPLARRVFELLDPEVEELGSAADGCRLAAGGSLLRLRGRARALLAGERTALNLLGRLCGIATLTRRVVEAARGTRCRILDTRKTTPGLRLLEKYAVRCGGGENHRLGLYDMGLIKENHLVFGGGLGEAVRRARRELPASLRLQVEVTDLPGLEEALAAGADLVLLDNMDAETMAEAVRRARGRAELEASGGIAPEAAGTIARRTGVDRISLGALTRAAAWADVSMDLAASPRG
jgi:nicotinate-nucleotide pyrophosphorylase (carboxylating)